MKHILLLTATALISFGGFSQTCTPDAQYANNGPGLYPAGPLGPTCELTAPKTIISLTDTLLETQLGLATFYIDAMSVDSVAGLPAGLELGTDVMGLAAPAWPYGYWENSGVVPNQTSAIGCAYVFGTGGNWDAAIGGGPNNDGVYPLTFYVDARINTTSNATINLFIPGGTWVSDIDASQGGGYFFIYDTLVVTQDYANISTAITGDANVAPATQYTYSVPMDANVDYNWTITNGTIVSGQGTNEVVVTWNGSGNIEVDLTDGGCMGTDNMDVTAIPTGIDEVVGINASIYPNPNNGIFTLRLDATDALNVRIMDVSGKTIRSEQLSGSTLYNIDMQSAPAGVYIMEIESTEGRTFKRLIKN